MAWCLIKHRGKTCHVISLVQFGTAGEGDLLLVPDECRRLFEQQLFSRMTLVVMHHNLYSSPNVIRMIKSSRMRWAGHVARMGETRNAYRILVRKPEGKRPLGRPRRR
jgi:hypothetical protein